MLIPIDRIKTRSRIRKDLGDLGPLMESLDAYGLMNPIVVNTRDELIAGQRRLESARRLGWTSIEVHVVDRATALEMLELELEENLHRLDFTDEELADARHRLEKLRNPGFFKKLLLALFVFLKRILRIGDQPPTAP